MKRAAVLCTALCLLLLVTLCACERAGGLVSSSPSSSSDALSVADRDDGAISSGASRTSSSDAQSASEPSRPASSSGGSVSSSTSSSVPDEGGQSEARSGVPTDPPASSASAPAGEPSDAPRDAVPAVGTGSVDLRVASDASGASSGSDASDPPDSAGALGVPDGEGAATVRDSAPDSASSEYEAIPYEENYHGHVYRTRTGECYHFESPCGRGTYFETTWEEVERLGLRACEKCVLH